MAGGESLSGLDLAGAYYRDVVGPLVLARWPRLPSLALAWVVALMS